MTKSHTSLLERETQTSQEFNIKCFRTEIPISNSVNIYRTKTNFSATLSRKKKNYKTHFSMSFFVVHKTILIASAFVLIIFYSRFSRQQYKLRLTLHN